MRENIKLSGDTKKIPIVKIKMMTDDEWNRLAYRNAMERRLSHESK